MFEPVKVDGRWLFDGAIVNPVPVSVARALGAERVIAFNISSELVGRGTAIQDPFGRAGAAGAVVEPANDEQRRHIAAGGAAAPCERRPRPRQRRRGS